MSSTKPLVSLNAGAAILAIAAHPDDLEFSCTGLLDRVIADGGRVVYLIATNGEHGFKDDALGAEERVAVREREQLAAAETLGVERVRFLRRQDGFLDHDESLRAELVAAIRAERPDAVLTFDPANRSFDNLNLFHRDHRVIAEATFDACFAAKNRFMYPGEPHRVQKMLFFGTAEPTDRFVLGEEGFRRKLAILECHASQFSDLSKVESLMREIHRRDDEPDLAEFYRVVDVEQLI